MPARQATKPTAPIPASPAKRDSGPSVAKQAGRDEREEGAGQGGVVAAHRPPSDRRRPEPRHQATLDRARRDSVGVPACARPRRCAAGCSRRPVTRRIRVNGTRISRNTSIETRKPANRNTTPRNLPSSNSLRRSRAGSRLSVTARDERADRDEERRRHPAVEVARQQRPDGAGQRRDEVDDDRDRRDEQVEQELVAGLVRVERVVEDARLGMNT